MKYQITVDSGGTLDIEADEVTVSERHVLEFRKDGRLIAAFNSGRWDSFNSPSV